MSYLVSSSTSSQRLPEGQGRTRECIACDELICRSSSDRDMRHDFQAAEDS